MNIGHNSKCRIVATDLKSTFCTRLFRKRERSDLASSAYDQVWHKQINQLDLLEPILGHSSHVLGLTHGRFCVSPFFPARVLLAYFFVGSYTEHFHRTVIRLNENIREGGVKSDLRNTMGRSERECRHRMNCFR